MKYQGKMFLLCAFMAVAACANANDIDYGSYARSIAMGGAGLALSDNAGASLVNPAANAASGAKFGFMWPSIDLNSRGATLSDLQNKTSEVSDTDTYDAITLAEDFGKQKTSLNLGFSAGITGGIGITVEGEAQGLINPGTNFQNWVKAGHPSSASDLMAAGLISDTSAATLTTYANSLSDGTYVKGTYLYSAPAVTYGSGFSTGNGKLWVGTKLRYIHSEVRNWNMTAAADTYSGNVALIATESPSQKDNSFGADLGFILQPKSSKMQYGAVINNAVEPKLTGVSTPAMFSVGSAFYPNRKTVIVADVVNINQAYDEKTRLRLGAEWSLTRKFALRAGYSGTRFTGGVDFLGMNIAFASEAPAMITRTLRY